MLDFEDLFGMRRGRWAPGPARERVYHLSGEADFEWAPCQRAANAGSREAETR